MGPTPTIVLVTGAFHLKSGMDLLSAQLEQSGYKTRTWGLVSVNRPDLSVRDDIAALTNDLLRPLIVDEHRDIILYLHSYSGIPGSAAIATLSKSERSAKGQEGGILGLVYQSGFVPTEGDTLLGMIGGKHAPWQEVHYDTGMVKVLDPKQTFYSDVPEPLATEASAKVLDHPLAIFHAPSGPVFYGTESFDNRRAYIHTTKDEALPPFVQDFFIVNSKVEWDVRKIDTSHSPFLSEPTLIAEMVVDMVKGFIATY
ncbi:MAG: hypothetical protein Q9211_003933 [Gyalolechia sp. 1 TL-2023]